MAVNIETVADSTNVSHKIDDAIDIMVVKIAEIEAITYTILIRWFRLFFNALSLPIDKMVMNVMISIHIADGMKAIRKLPSLIQEEVMI